MSAALDPLIASKLAAFGQRWRLLIILRGLCGGVITLLGTMTVVAFLDLLIILPDSARWTLSAVGYGATAAVVWFTCLRSLRHLPGPHELARLVEKARPDLREDLLSAVELGDNKSSRRSGRAFSTSRASSCGPGRCRWERRQVNHTTAAVAP